MCCSVAYFLHWFLGIADRHNHNFLFKFSNWVHLKRKVWWWLIINMCERNRMYSNVYLVLLAYYNFLRFLHVFFYSNCMDFEGWMELCELYLSQCDYEKAAFCVEELILSNPNNHLFHQRYAEVSNSLNWKTWNRGMTCWLANHGYQPVIW